MNPITWAFLAFDGFMISCMIRTFFVGRYLRYLIDIVDKASHEDIKKYCDSRWKKRFEALDRMTNLKQYCKMIVMFWLPLKSFVNEQELSAPMNEPSEYSRYMEGLSREGRDLYNILQGQGVPRPNTPPTLN